MTTETFVGTFNVLNLISADFPYYDKDSYYSPADFEKKTRWIGQQLDRMRADVVGFQEVFHTSALQAALDQSEHLRGVRPIVVGTQETERPGVHPGVALVAKGGAELIGAITAFPEVAKLNSPELSVSINAFSRPVLKARVQLFPSMEVTVFVVHLKSKRPSYIEGESPKNPVHRALGSARSLIRRAAEAAALRALVLDEIRGQSRPVIVIGDLNDTERSVTTQMISGDPPFYRVPRAQKEEIWDTLLYSAQEIQLRQSTRDLYFTHIFNGFYESLDHILVSEEFYSRNPDRVAELDFVRVLTDHLQDETQTMIEGDPLTSDHGQVVARIRLRTT